MIIGKNNIAKIFFFVGAVIFLSMSFFGLYHFSTQMNSDMSMSNCPFMVGMSLCTMTPFEHISAWQNIFGNVPVQNGTIVMLLFAVSLALAFLLTRKINSPPKYPLDLRRHLHFEKYIPAVHFLQELFSDGILNPKTF